MAVCSNREQLETFLTQNGIPFRTQEHEPVMTVDALMQNAHQMPGLHHKNLFLKSKKTNSLYLLVARHDAVVNLNTIARHLGIGSGSLRMASAEQLEEMLGVKQGAVTIFALVNDTNHNVTLLLDSNIMKSDADQQLWFHPLQNDATTAVSPSSLQLFLNVVGHKPVNLEL